MKEHKTFFLPGNRRKERYCLQPKEYFLSCEQSQLLLQYQPASKWDLWESPPTPAVRRRIIL